MNTIHFLFVSEIIFFFDVLLYLKEKKSMILSEGIKFDTKDGMLPSAWGSCMWVFLGCIGRNFPLQPNDQQVQQHILFIESLCFVLPCSSCRHCFSETLESLDWDRNKRWFLSCRENFSRFINFLHNATNYKLGKRKTISYEKHREKYERFRSTCSPGIHNNFCEGRRTGDIPAPKCRITFS